MCELKKIEIVFGSKSVGTGPSYYEKSVYLAAVSRRLRNAGIVCTSLFKSFIYNVKKSV